MRIFDCHTHVFPDAIAARVLAGLQSAAGGLPFYTDGTASGLRRHALAAGCTGWMNAPVVTRPGQSAGVNRHAAAANTWPALSLGGVHPLDDDPAAVIRTAREQGLHGIKLHPEYLGLHLLDPAYEPIWNTCESLAFPVLMHAGADVGFRPPYHSTPADFAELIRRHPGLTLICAHMGGWNVWDEVERDLVGAPVYFDTAFSFSWMKDTDRFLRIVRAHGADRILFGTDSPWYDVGQGIRDLLSLPLTPAERSAIFWDNARRIWPDALPGDAGATAPPRSEPLGKPAAFG